MTAKLLISKDKFKAELILQITEGKAIAELIDKANDQQSFEWHEKNFRIWNDYNREWLKQAFTIANSEYAKQYELSRTAIEKLKFVKFGYSPESEYYRRAFLGKDINTKIEHLESLLSRIDLIPQEVHELPAPILTASTTLTHLHQAVQQSVGSRFANGYYSDALHKACTALEKAVQDKANQPLEPTGATLMSKVFSKDKPLLTVSHNQGEQEGYMFLYRGLTQAIRNHYAHNDTSTDPSRALEWLGFISALFYKLDEAQSTTPTML